MKLSSGKLTARGAKQIYRGDSVSWTSLPCEKKHHRTTENRCYIL
jgi:hypothetical protein